MVKKGTKRINKINNPEQYTVGIYIRTGKKIEGIDAISFQKDRVEEFCNDMGLKIAEVYIDDGCNLFSKERPSLKKLIDDIKAKKINLVVTANLNRIAINNYEMKQILQWQKEYNFRTILTDSRQELLEDKTGTLNIEEYFDNNEEDKSEEIDF